MLSSSPRPSWPCASRWSARSRPRPCPSCSVCRSPGFRRAARSQGARSCARSRSCRWSSRPSWAAWRCSPSSGGAGYSASSSTRSAYGCRSRPLAPSSRRPSSPCRSSCSRWRACSARSTGGWRTRRARSARTAGPSSGASRSPWFVRPWPPERRCAGRAPLASSAPPSRSPAISRGAPRPSRWRSTSSSRAAPRRRGVEPRPPGGLARHVHRLARTLARDAMSLEASVRLRRGTFELDVALAVEAGETAAILGPNGCGKTTLLHALAGLVPLDEGRVTLDGVVMEDAARGIAVATEQRPIAVVFQNQLLFPHMSALDNVAFGLRCHGRPRAEARRVARQWLESMGLADHARARPDALSGGQGQRVALARALAVEPRMLLLDEPLAAVDVQGRAELRRDLRRHLASFGGVRLLVTHDPLE